MLQEHKIGVIFVTYNLNMFMLINMCDVGIFKVKLVQVQTVSYT